MICQGTKYYLVVGDRRATESAGAIVLGVAVGIWAHLLEENRVVRGAAIACRITGAAVSVLVEHRACIFTPPWHLQLAWTLQCDVGWTAWPLAH